MARKYTTEVLARDRWSEWDVFVNQTPQGTIFHRSEWLLALTGDPNSISFLVCRDASGAIVGGLPLVKRPIRWYTTYRLPPLTPYAGLVLSDPSPAKLANQQGEQKDKALALLAALPPAALTRFPLALGNTDTQPFRWHGYQTTIGHTYRLPQSLTPDEMWKIIDSTLRRAIRKAEKDGVLVKPSTDIEDLLPLIHLTFAKQNLGMPQSEDTYRRLWAAAQNMGRGTIYFALRPNEKPSSGTLVVWDSRSTYLLLSGTDLRERVGGVGPLALWQAILGALARGQAFDFEGSTLPAVERFYRRWGGQLCPIVTVEKITSLPLRMMSAWRDHKAARAMIQMFSAIHRDD